MIFIPRFNPLIDILEKDSNFPTQQENERCYYDIQLRKEVLKRKYLNGAYDKQRGKNTIGIKIQDRK